MKYWMSIGFLEIHLWRLWSLSKVLVRVIGNRSENLIWTPFLKMKSQSMKKKTECAIKPHKTDISLIIDIDTA